MGRRAHGEGNIRRRHDGRWEGRIRVDGERLTYCAATKGDVADWLLDVRRRAGLALPTTDSSETVQSFLRRWIKDKESSVRESTIYSYRHIVEDQIIPRLGTRSLAKLSPLHVSAFLAEMRDDGRYNARTQQLALTVLRMALTTAEKWGLVGRNVAKLVDGPRQEKKEIQPLDPSDAAKLVAALRGDEYEAALLLDLALGLRRGELLGLRWEDRQKGIEGLDLDAGIVHVRVGLQKLPKKPWRLVPLKTKGSRRDLVLPSSVVPALKEHRKRQAAEKLKAGRYYRDHGFVFAAPDGEPIALRAPGDALHRALERVKLAGRRLHDLRHSAASILLAEGVSVRDVQELLGHSLASTTLNVYAHALPAGRKLVADRMDALLATGGQMGGNSEG